MERKARKLTRDEQIEQMEREHYTKIRLGYRPEAAPPNLANVTSKINNKHERKLAKKPTKGQPHRKEYVEDEYWPPTPPEKKKPVEVLKDSETEEDDFFRQKTVEPSSLQHKSYNNLHSIDDPPLFNPEAYKRIQGEEDDFYIRESQSAPLETAKDPYILAEELRPSRPTDSQKAFDVFRPPGFQRPVHSGESGQYLLNGVNQGIYVANEPLPMEEATADYEEDLAKQMWLEAVNDLKKDNKRQRLRQEEQIKDEQRKTLAIADAFCFFPCFCCCYCICSKMKKKKHRRKI